MGTVPATILIGPVSPLEQLLAVAVEDVGVELDDALRRRLGLIVVVDAVTIGREGVGHLQHALANLDIERARVLQDAVEHRHHRDLGGAGKGEVELGSGLVARDVDACRRIADVPLDGAGGVESRRTVGEADVDGRFGIEGSRLHNFGTGLVGIRRLDVNSRRSVYGDH